MGFPIDLPQPQPVVPEPRAREGETFPATAGIGPLHPHGLPKTPMSRLTLTGESRAGFHIGSGSKKTRGGLTVEGGNLWKDGKRGQNPEACEIVFHLDSATAGCFYEVFFMTHQNQNLGMIVQKSQWNPDAGWFEWMSVPKFFHSFPLFYDCEGGNQKQFGCNFVH